jgi:hypothetical protein
MTRITQRKGKGWAGLGGSRFGLMIAFGVWSVWVKGE